MRSAIAIARMDRASSARIGWRRTWADVLGKALEQAWRDVRAARELEALRRARAALPGTEQQARTLELQAELLADRMIGRADRAEADRQIAALRTRAAALRSTEIQQAA